MKTLTQEQIAALSTEELGELRLNLSAEREAIKEQLRMVVATLDKRLIEQNAQMMIYAMSDDQKRALLQILQPKGIESAEAFGNPRGN
jgi:hypothetical protein